MENNEAPKVIAKGVNEFSNLTSLVEYHSYPILAKLTTLNFFHIGTNDAKRRMVIGLIDEKKVCFV